MYLKIMEFMNTFEMLQNMMNHMDEYQTMFQMFEGFGGENPSSGASPLTALAPFLGGGGFSMPDLSSMQNIMKGSDLVDEFTYVEEPSGACGDGS